LTDNPAGTPSWIDLARNVLDDQISRWDATTCGGGLRWQIFSFSNGYDYKNSASNGGFFQLAARYARYTSNQTYAAWAEEIYDWTKNISFIDDQWNVYDGAQVYSNCTPISHLQFSYLAGTYITGAAHMYNMTNGAAKWKAALDGLLNNTLNIFFPNDIMTEVACESAQTCTVDFKAFKGITVRWLAATVQMAPYTYTLILPKLTASAQAAVKQCDGNNECGFKWTAEKSDGDTGLGQQMNALAVVQALLVGDAALPATITTGGVAPGNSSSSSNLSSSSGPSSGSGAGTTSSSTAGAASTSATSKTSSAAEPSLETAKMGMFSVLLAFIACIVL
jgi:mannan endo-1,6-alpha-mannosidase